MFERRDENLMIGDVIYEQLFIRRDSKSCHFHYFYQTFTVFISQRNLGSLVPKDALAVFKVPFTELSFVAQMPNLDRCIVSRSLTEKFFLSSAEKS